MKKIFTLMMLAASSAAAMATDYNDQLVVVMNGMEIANKPSTISVEQNEDKTYKLSINNFVLTPGMNVGNIVVDNVKGVDGNGATYLATNQTIQITPGDLEGVGEKDWMGPGLGDVPVEVKAEVRGDKLTANIDISMQMGDSPLTINVNFGSGYQIKNSGFEDFHKAEYTAEDWMGNENTYSSDEPNAWHSFNSGISADELTAMALQYGSTSISSDVRPGSTGKSSVAIKSAYVIFMAANGTMTTGRMKAGNIVATNPANCAFLDMSLTDVDGNGDPFYTVLNGRPDTLAVWVKYKQGQVNEEYPYANVSAVITDGTYYQDPEDDRGFTNVVAKAQDKEIESKDFTWQRLAIPFDYETYAANNAEPKAILVTISTNAQPGVGSNDTKNPDSILVDDIELIYNSTVTGINVKGEAVEGFNNATSDYVVGIAGDNADITADDIEVLTDANGAKVFVDVADLDETGEGSWATITVLSADLKNSSTYTVKTFTEDYLTGITNVATDGNEAEAIYNLNGQRVHTPAKGQVYITKYANGKTLKTVKK